jgi:hypothetical protein
MAMNVGQHARSTVWKAVEGNEEDNKTARADVQLLECRQKINQRKAINS